MTGLLGSKRLGLWKGSGGKETLLVLLGCLAAATTLQSGEFDEAYKSDQAKAKVFGSKGYLQEIKTSAGQIEKCDKTAVEKAELLSSSYLAKVHLESQVKQAYMPMEKQEKAFETALKLGGEKPDWKKLKITPKKYKAYLEYVLVEKYKVLEGGMIFFRAWSTSFQNCPDNLLAAYPPNQLSPTWQKMLLERNVATVDGSGRWTLKPLGMKLILASKLFSKTEFKASGFDSVRNPSIGSAQKSYKSIFGDAALTEFLGAKIANHDELKREFDSILEEQQ